MGNSLSKTGQRMLAEKEAVIENGLAGFLAIGKALRGIRDERLYRENFDNFETYLSGRWGMSRARAYQLMEALDLSTIVDNAGALPLANEGQLRALAPIKNNVTAVRGVIEAAQADGDTSARNLSKYVKDFQNAHTQGATGDEGEVAEGDVGEAEPPAHTADDGAASHDDGRNQPEPVSPPPLVALTPDEVSMPCPHCGGTGVLTARAS